MRGHGIRPGKSCRLLGVFDVEWVGYVEFETIYVIDGTL